LEHFLNWARGKYSCLKRNVEKTKPPRSKTKGSKRNEPTWGWRERIDPEANN